jgi:dTDP-3-amino-3,4,6-trideoxy-alpha-D-glucose transaminase
MRVAAASLRPAIEETRAAWQARLSELFASDQYILGAQGAAFEDEFARATGARFAVGCGSGTAALEICMREAGLTDARSDVLTTPLTAPFTGIGLRSAGPRVVFADVDPETLLLDPEDAGNRLTKRVKAIVPVHLYGQPCPMDRIREVAEGRLIVQDAAQAHGARWLGRPLTEFSDYVTYSFYPTKNLGALGDAGAIATNGKRIAGRLRMLRDGGRRGGQISFVAGINSRLDEIQACYLRAFLPYLEEWNGRRARLAARYDEGLRDCAGVRRVKTGPASVNHLYVVRAKKRERLRKHLAEKGIGSGVHYPLPLHLHPAFSGNGLKRGDLPVAERACREVVSLPLRPHLSFDSVEQVIEAVRSFYR